LRHWLSFFNRLAISLPVAMFGLMSVAILIGSTLFQDSLNRSANQSVSQLIQESQARTVSQLEAYALLARSGVGLLRTDNADNANWNTYYESIGVGEDFPGVGVVGYAGVTADTLGTGEPDVRLSLAYPNSSEVRQNLGRDLGSLDERVQRQVMSAISLGEVRIAEAPDQGGLYIITPVYATQQVPGSESERLVEFRGVVVVVVDASSLFEAAYAKPEPALSSLVISTPRGEGENSVLYRGGRPARSGDLISEQRQLNIMGQQFRYDYEFAFNRLVPPTQRFLTLSMPITGLTLALLLSLVVSFVLRSRNQRLSIAREREVQAAKDELLSLASHQLRTPATGVKQYLGMVLQGFAGKISDIQTDFLERAYASNERQLHIINDILYLAKLDAGRIVLTKTRFDLADLVRSVADELQESLSEGGLELTVQVPNKAAVYADSHMLRMVIENLMTNAIKYTPSGGSVTLKLYRSDDDYRISVTDTGVGIADSDRDRLFVQFSRIPNERSSEVTGTGVGLYLARSLARLHGGDVTVKSKLGKGSKFTISLPRGL